MNIWLYIAFPFYGQRAYLALYRLSPFSMEFLKIKEIGQNGIRLSSYHNDAPYSGEQDQTILPHIPHYYYGAAYKYNEGDWCKIPFAKYTPYLDSKQQYFTLEAEIISISTISKDTQQRCISDNITQKIDPEPNKPH